ncbi:RND transporter [Polymorphobacter glacialis]|uniref:RND transporter n=1 Tax=Sandarakinorhabdus glacialis TaxID=1614636 RepID=A0A916ZLS5_9SPHN|nr:efflux RND transporter periplasmic adaptor subunit [Polymorphobacter glacialis]GGE03998.1 RND transporter [Polymorphobacter glacialis]
MRPDSRSRLMGAAVLVLALAGCGRDEDKAGKARPPALVGAMAAANADFAPRLTALGTVTPLQSVAVRPRTDGQITAILFREGDNVRSGQQLFRLDDRAARAELAQARANVASAQASAVQARGDFTRAEQLVGKGFVSAAVLDQRRALAGSAEAAISGALAQVKSAETALDYLTIRAPVSGRTGEIGFRLGATVRSSDAVSLVTVNQLSPIQVRFLVPPEQIQHVRAAMAGPGLTVTALPQQGGGPPIATGRLAFLDNNVDPGNGSVTAKAEFVNVGDVLWPGAIVNVQLPLGASAPRIALPESAVQTGRDAPFVWAVGGDGKVVMRDVTVAGRADGRVFLASGVKPGETIVVDALSKLKPGDKVRTRAGAPRVASAAPAVAG